MKLNDYPVTVLADKWEGLAVAEAFAKELGSQAVNVVYKPWGAQDFPAILYVGNGEVLESSKRVYGEPVTGKLWEISLKNLSTAKARFKDMGIPHEARSIRWLGASPRELEILKLSETSENSHECLLFSPKDIVVSYLKRLSAKGVLIHQGTWPNLSRASSTRHSFSIGNASWVSTFLVNASESFPRDAWPSLRETWMSVTLCSFLAPSTKAVEPTLMSMGSEFVLPWAGKVRVGSFRALYQDDAFGLTERHDKITHQFLQPVSDKFGLGVKARDFEEVRHAESLSCDGLPIVGPTSESPTVFAFGGFSARTGNFVFPLAELLAQGIGQGRWHKDLKVFSTKRFV